VNANLEAYVNHIYEELQGDLPEMSEFAAKAAILTKLRERASEQADELIAVHLLTEQIKALSVLMGYQQP
jgi:hypothetical protein